MKSKLVHIVEALEMGIPIEYNGGLFKMFKEDNNYEIKTAMVKYNSKTNKVNHVYISDIPFTIVLNMARDFDDGDILNLVHIKVQLTTKLEKVKGFKLEDATYPHEDEFFDNLEKRIKKSINV
jgi:hypothetical protein